MTTTPCYVFGYQANCRETSTNDVGGPARGLETHTSRPGEKGWARVLCIKLEAFLFVGKQAVLTAGKFCINIASIIVVFVH